MALYLPEGAARWDERAELVAEVQRLHDVARAAELAHYDQVSKLRSWDANIYRTDWIHRYDPDDPDGYLKWSFSCHRQYDRYRDLWNLQLAELYSQSTFGKHKFDIRRVYATIRPWSALDTVLWSAKGDLQTMKPPPRLDGKLRG